MKDTVIADLDGTIALIEHRLHHIHSNTYPHPGFKPDWRAFFAACKDDLPNTQVIRILRRLSDDLRIHIVSGRSDEVRAETINWLKQQQVPFDNLIMRKEGDHTPDDVLKRSWIDTGIIDKERVFCVLDDRKRVVDMWRSYGFTTLQVAEGEF